MKKLLLWGLPVAVIAGLLILFSAHSVHSLGASEHGAHSGMMKDFLMYRIDRATKDLNLNADQQKSLDALKNDLQNMMDQHQQHHRTIHAAMHDELTKDSPDFGKIKPLLD